MDGQPGLQHEQHRLARDLRGDGDGQRVGHRPRHAPRQPFGERRREDQEPRRGEHAQREPEVAGEPGIVRQQDDHGERQGGEPAGRPAARGGADEHGGHDRGAAHAGLRGHQHDEGSQGGEGRDRASGAPQADRGGQREDEAHDDRAVRAGHGGEVRERAVLHGLGEVGRHGRHVTDRESGEQLRAGTGERGRGVRETRAQPVRGGERSRRRCRLLQRAAGEEQVRRAVGRIRGADGRARPHDGPDAEVPAPGSAPVGARSAREDDDGHGRAEDDRAVRRPPVRPLPDVQRQEPADQSHA
ncbi:hypothetical protein AES38_07375 [Clavibacter capsici]|nr:hypothetical protein AES38_07375 [Clavibacter capsici]